MKFPSIKNITIAIAAAAMICSVTSCVKEKFSLPPSTNADPVGVYATMTITQFKNLYCGGSRGNALDSIVPVLIKDSIILSGVINGDDRSGNIYKTLIFQDSTGALEVVADVSDLYNTYPVGTRIFVKCKGMYLFNYAGTLELGSYINYTGAQPALGSVPAVNLTTYVLKGKTGLTVIPKHWTVFNLVNTADPLYDQNTLIEVDGVQFINADTSMTYGDAINQASANLTLEDSVLPTANTVIVRSSGFANFATAKPAIGYGSVVGIFSLYQESNGSVQNQITIRDTTDVLLNTPRRVLAQ